MTVGTRGLGTMDVEVVQYVAHGTGGNFSRWYDEVVFRFGECLRDLGGDGYDTLTVDLMLPGPRGDFGAAGVDVSPNGDRRLRARLQPDPASYGVATDSRERIRLLIEAFAELARETSLVLGGSPEEAEALSARVDQLRFEIPND